MSVVRRGAVGSDEALLALRDVGTDLALLTWGSYYGRVPRLLKQFRKRLAATNSKDALAEVPPARRCTVVALGGREGGRAVAFPIAYGAKPPRTTTIGIHRPNASSRHSQ